MQNKTEQQKAEGLIKPRYKVIADYPDSCFIVGEILKLEFREHNGRIWGFERNGIFDEKYLLKYPHIFKKLEWWEGMGNSEPYFVKHIYSAKAYKVFYNGNGKWTKDINGKNINLSNTIPILESEYTAYLNKTNQ